MDLQLAPEQSEFKKLAREFLEAEVVPHRRQWDRDEAVDPGIPARIGGIGFFGITVPEEYGGLGGDWITYCVGLEELGRADSAVRGIVSVSAGLVGKTALIHGKLGLRGQATAELSRDEVRVPARLLTWRAAGLAKGGEPFATAASKAKLFVSEAAVKAANLAIQIFGGYGYVDEYPVQKLMRDARVMTLYEGTSQIQKLLIGRAETGISAF